MTNTKDIIEDIFIAYKLSFSLEELLSDKSILVAYELSQALNGSIKAGVLSCKIFKGSRFCNTYYWCSIFGVRADPILDHYENRMQDISIMDIYNPSINEITDKVAFQYDHCLECYLNYKTEEEE